jgi:hypothetical protein
MTYPEPCGAAGCFELVRAVLATVSAARVAAGNRKIELARCGSRTPDGGRLAERGQAVLV